MKSIGRRANNFSFQVGDRDYFDRLGPCPELPVNYERSILHRCVPSDKNAPLTKIRKAYDLLNSWDTYREILRDFYASWYIILGVSASAVIFSLIIILMLHCVTQIVSWLICITVGLASIVITAVLWKTYIEVRHDNIDAVQRGGYLEGLLKNQTAILVLAVIATIVMITLIILIFVIKDKLKGLAALFEEAGKCMFSLPGLVLPPILSFIALSLFLSFWVWIMVCLSTANYPFQKQILPPAETYKELFPKNETTSVDPNYKSLLSIEYVNVKWLNGMTWYYLVALIWVSEFIFACQQMAIAGAVVFWYFRKPVDSPVFAASEKLLTYHLGSIAKGSFLITIFKIPRLILMYFYSKMKKGEGQSGCAECGLKCCICCFWMLEKFIRYLNHNAYTVIAIESLNFCPAAGVAWKSLVSNALSVATINGVGDFILFLGKLAVATITGIIAIFILKGKEEVNMYIVVATFIAIVGFFIAHIILSLYEMVVDTLFLCVCEDKNINGNTGRWRESNLAHLIGEEPAQRDAADSVEAPMQQVELNQVHRQPFHQEDPEGQVITRQPFQQY